jgi:hypothetical protein
MIPNIEWILRLQPGGSGRAGDGAVAHGAVRLFLSSGIFNNGKTRN